MNVRRPNSEALRPDLRLSRSRSQRPARLRSLQELKARVCLKVSTMRAGSNHVQQPAVRQHDDSPDTPRRADLREGLNAQLRTGIRLGESRPSPHAFATHHRRRQSTNGSCNHSAAHGLCQSLSGLKRRQASTRTGPGSRSISIRETPFFRQSLLRRAAKRDSPMPFRGKLFSSGKISWVVHEFPVGGSPGYLLDGRNDGRQQHP